MDYGPVTKKHLAELNSGEFFNSSAQWNADEFTLPFSDRLLEMISEYTDLPAGKTEALEAARRLILDNCSEKNIKFSRTTLAEWLDNSRDPSVTGSEESTRENIYKLAAVLDFDYELTCELFEKVFFTRAFNPKSMVEMCYCYFANKDFKNGVSGAEWYTSGKNVADNLTMAVPENTAEADIVQSSLIIDSVDTMKELEFIEFLSENAITFSKNNQCMSAKELVREYAVECCDSEDIPYDSLIAEIIGYSQRGVGNTTVSSAKYLPAQLTANFPNGQILRSICLDQENGYDKIYKMLVLLLFYSFHKDISTGLRVENRFMDFISFANQELERVGFVDLYPKQPYCGLILFCAAQNNPVQALQNYIGVAMATESQKLLYEKLRSAYPDAAKDILQEAADRIDGNTFIGDFIAKNNTLIKPEEISDDCESILQIIYGRMALSEKEKDFLRYLTIIPADGISRQLFSELFRIYSNETPRFIESGWITEKGKLYLIDYRCRNAIIDADLMHFPKWSNCSEFVKSITEKYNCCEDKNVMKQLSAMLRRASHLDGIPQNEKELLLSMIKHE